MKTKVLIDLKIVCDPPRYLGRYCPTLESKANELQRWCDEFHEFMRDHRSQDPVSLSVELEYEEQCSHCHYQWDVDETGMPACCDKAQEEFKASQQPASDAATLSASVSNPA